MAAQEGQIMNFAQRLAGTGTVVGVSQKDIMALSAAMASVGINAESGGSAMSKVLTKMNTAVKDGGEKLQGFASIAGISGQEFAETWKKDPYKAVQQFEQGLAKQNKEGKNVKQMLKELGITELRETDTVLRLANGNKQLDVARQNANKGYKEGNALSKEAETKYKTLGNQMKIFMNHVRDLGIEIGSVLAPILITMMKVLTPVINALAKAPAPIKLMVVALGLIPIVAVPVLASLAAITGAMGLMGQAMNTATFAAGNNSRALKLYALSMGLLTSPISTVKKGLMSIPGLFWKTGGAAKGSSGGIKVAASGMLSLLNPMKLIKGVLPALSLGFRGLLLAFRILTGPIGLIVTGIVLLYKAFKSAYDNVEWFRKGVDGLVYTFKVFGGGIIGAVAGKIKDLGNWFAKAGSQIKNGFTKDLKEGYQALDDDDLLKQGVNGFKKAMEVLGTASKKASDSTKVLGKGVSKETKSALGNYIKYSDSSSKILEGVKLNHGKISKNKASELISIEDKLSKDLIDKLEQRKQAELKNAQEVFEDSKALSQKEKDAIIAGIEDKNNKAISKEKELSAKIKQVKEAAMADGNISEKEMAQIEKLENQRRDLTVKNLTKTQKEQDKILSRMKNNREALSVSEASSVIKSAEKAKKARIKEINDEYDDKVYAIDQMVGLSKEQKQKLLDEAEDDKNKQIDKANEKKEGVVKTVKDQNKGIEDEMDTSNGKVYSNAEKWLKKTGTFISNDWNSFWSDVGQQTSGIVTWFGEQGKEMWAKFQEGWKIATQAGGNLWEWIKSTGTGIGGWFSEQGKQFSSAFKEGWATASKAGGDLWGWIKQTGSGIGGWFSQQGADFATRFKNGWKIASQTGADLWSWIKQTGGSIGGWFAQKGRDFWNSLKNGWSALINSNPGAMWTSITSALGTAWAATKQWFVTKGQQMGSALSQGWTAMKGFVVNTFSSIWTSIKSIWQGIWGTITYWTGAIWNRIKMVWTWIKTNTFNAFNSVWNTIKRIWGGIKGTIVYWTTAIWNRIKSVWSWIKSNTLGAFNYVWNTIKRIWAGIKGTIVYWTSAIWNRVKAVWGWIKSNTANAFTWVWNKIKSIWAGIKGTITYWTGAIWNRVKAVWSWIKSNTASAFTWVWNKIKSIWAGIKGTITYWTGVIWDRIKSIWTNIKNFTANIFNSVWGTVKRIWTNIKNAVVDRATSMWNKVRGIWNSLKSGTADIFNKAKNTVKSAFEFMKKHSVDLVTGMWDKVGKVFNNMKKGVENFAGNVKDGINGMVDGVKTGLNGLIKAVNWVGGKLGIDKKIPKLHTGTESTHTQSFVSNGAISRPTLATVNDKGSGNGSGPNGHQELIQRKNGSVFAPQGRDVTVPLQKGDKVINGKATQQMQRAGMIPRFSKGTFTPKDLLKKTKKHKHDEEVHGDIPDMFGPSGGGKTWDTIKAAGSAGKKVIGKKVDEGKEKVKKGVESTKNALGAAGNWAKNKAGDLLDWVGKPGKLLDKVMEEFGVDFGKIKGDIPKNLWGGMWKGLKGGVKSLFDGWLSEADAGGGDGGYIDLSKGINFPFSPNGRAPGYPFPYPHMGVDLNYVYDKLYSVASGTATSSTTAGGFGKHVTITDGIMKYIYGHMSKFAFNGSKKVKPGDYLGVSGNTGMSSGPHLHFEVQKNGKPIDPIKWLKENQGGGKNKKASAWSGDIKKAAKQMKVNLSGRELNGIIAQIQRESNGNAGVTQGNIGDINNLRGTPAQGLLQYVPSTFKSYAVKGHKNIKNGYDQLLAFFNNSNWRRDLPYGRSGWGPSGRRRFAHGGMIKKHGLYEAGEGNRAEMVLPLTNKVRAMQLIDQAKSFMGVDDGGNISTNNNNNNSNNDVIAQLLEQNNKLLQALIGTVEDKKLIVDGNAITDYVGSNQANKFSNSSYFKGNPTIR